MVKTVENTLTLLECYGVEMSISKRVFSTVGLWNFRVCDYAEAAAGLYGGVTYAQLRVVRIPGEGGGG